MKTCTSALAYFRLGGSGMKIIAASIFLLILSRPARAQIVLTREDDRLVLESNRSIVFLMADVEGRAFTLGGPGTGKLFDFSAYPYAYTHADGMRAVPGTPPSPFWGATHAAVRVPDDPYVRRVIEYYMLKTTARYYRGKDTDNGLIRTQTVWDPPGLDYPFPCTLGMVWTDDVTANSYDYGSGRLITSRTVYRSADVQASGTLRLPFGDYPCLRMLRIERIGNRKRSFHEFATKEGIRAIMEIDTIDEESDAPRVKSVIVTRYGAPTHSEALPRIPEEPWLGQNHPNPFRSIATISYGIDRATSVILRVFDMHGRTVAEPVNDKKPAGVHSTRIDGATLPAGIYIVRLEVGGLVRTRVMSLVK